MAMYVYVYRCCMHLYACIYVVMYGARYINRSLCTPETQNNPSATICSRIYGYLFVDVYMSRYECLRMNPQGMSCILQKGIGTIIDATIGCKNWTQISHQTNQSHNQLFLQFVVNIAIIFLHKSVQFVSWPYVGHLFASL